MNDTLAKISGLLSEAAETHHRVYRIVDGNDADWASWYSDWLIDLSELPQLLGRKPVRSHLVYQLVKLDAEYTSQPRREPWQDYYAGALLRDLGIDSTA